MYNSIKNYCDSLKKDFDTIPAQRKTILEKITQYIVSKKQAGAPINLVYICTHNSRRSHFGQVWAKVAGAYYEIEPVQTFSGGTEATAFHNNAINALIRIGFTIKPLSTEKNTIYNVSFDTHEDAIPCFSKVYNHPQNPERAFLAIMTCSEAEENCPYLPGAELRIATPYDDPKAFDHTPLQDEKYDERCKQIALETFYIFSNLK